MFIPTISALQPLTKISQMLLFILGCTFFISCGTGSESDTILTGFWIPQKYVMMSGESTEVTGHIAFSQNQWSVVFFVLDEDGNPTSASAEGGEYAVENNNLTFWHSYNFSDITKGEVSQLTKKVSSLEERQKEFCTIELEDDLMVIYFPSGNAMIFSKSS